MSLARIAYLCKLVEKEVGLYLTDDKMYLVESRLSPILTKHGFRNLEALNDALICNSHQALITEISEALVTHETFFFRDIYPYTYLEKLYLPDIIARNARERRIKIWCAGSSSGQEPYSLAMLIADKFPELRDWRIEFIATDVSHAVLSQAKAGSFSHFEIQRGLPVEYVLKYFENKDKNWVIKPMIRDMISFQQQNLQSFNTYHKDIDILMCRNVMLYFQPAIRKMIIDEFTQSLKPKGVLILGNTEAMMGKDHPVVPAVGQAGVFIKPSHEIKQAS